MRGDRLRACREAYGDTQRDLAEYLGVSVNSVANWENNRREPDALSLSRIAKRYGVSVDYLLGETDNPQRYENLPPGWEQVFIEAARRRLGPDEVLALVRQIGELWERRQSQRNQPESS